MQRRIFLGTLAASTLCQTAPDGAPLRLGMAGLEHGHASGFLNRYRDSKEVELVGVSEPTHIAVGPMNVHDGSALAPALAGAEARGLKPRSLLGDSHYGPEENLEEAARGGVEVIAPAMPPKGSQQGKLTLEDFALYGRGHVTRCPGGQVPPVDERGQGSDPGFVRRVGVCRVPPSGLVPGLGGGPQGAALPVHPRPGPQSRAPPGRADEGVRRSLPPAVGDRGDNVAAGVTDATGVAASERSGLGGLSDVPAGLGAEPPQGGGLSGRPSRPIRGILTSISAHATRTEVLGSARRDFRPRSGPRRRDGPDGRHAQGKFDLRPLTDFIAGPSRFDNSSSRRRTNRRWHSPDCRMPSSFIFAGESQSRRSRSLRG